MKGSMPMAAASAVLLAAVLLPAGPALAGLEICNGTADRHSVAIGYGDEGTWVSEGWWTLASGACKTVVGGRLKQRYYYYRVDGETPDFAGEGYFFCTTRKAFTIRGDENCAARGHDRDDFAKIDTGPDARDFTFTVGGAGTRGEPVSVTGVLSGCRPDGGRIACEVRADGWAYAFDDRTSDPAAMARIDDGWTGGTVTLRGEHVATEGGTARLVVHEIALLEAPAEQDSAIHDVILGRWRSTEDPASVVRFDDGRYADIYDGETVERGAYELAARCPDPAVPPGDDPMLVKRPVADPDAPYCYAVTDIQDDRLELLYLPAGRFLEFRRDSW